MRHLIGHGAHFPFCLVSFLCSPAHPTHHTQCLPTQHTTHHATCVADMPRCSSLPSSTRPPNTLHHTPLATPCCLAICSFALTNSDRTFVPCIRPCTYQEALIRKLPCLRALKCCTTLWPSYVPHAPPATPYTRLVMSSITLSRPHIALMPPPPWLPHYGSSKRSLSRVASSSRICPEEDEIGYVHEISEHVSEICEHHGGDKPEGCYDKI